MSTAFISYRRASAAGEARALFNDLVAQIGKRSVFMDVDSIGLGRDFRSVLEETLARCDLMLVLIDRNWLDAKDEQGQARLENPDDYVRLEIETALRRNIIVTPVLLQGAHVPAPEQLPPEIRDLAYRNGFVLDHGQWESGVDELVRRLGLTGSKRGRGVFLDWISNKRRISLAITLVVLLTVPVSIFILRPALRPQSEQFAADSKRFQVVLHIGKSDPGSDIERKVKSALLEAGYNVVSSDHKNDDYGSGVDFFSDDDCRGAADIANIVSKELPRNEPPLIVRRQKGATPAGRVGVWISQKPPDPSAAASCKG
jgi:hypothetical protein